MLDVILALPCLSHFLSLHDSPEEENDDFNLNIDVLNSDTKYLSANYFCLKQYDQPVFSFLNYNIRSLSSNFNNFTELMDSAKLKLDVILLTESWLSDESAESFQLNSYNGFHSYRTLQKGGGVSIFLRDIFNVVQVPEFTYMESFIELNTVKIENPQGADIIIIGIYRPPSGCAENCLTSLDKIISKFKNKKVIISGDLNANLLNFHDNQFVSSIISSFLNLGFYPTTKRATRLNSTNPKNSSLIDHTWTNLDNLIDSNIILTDIPDHFPCMSTFKNANPINLEEPRIHNVEI